MRLWSLDFSYLDSRGITACWRESLLARKVLEGNTVGYRNHPQLIRFRESSDPIGAINTYIFYLYKASLALGYSFNPSKVVNEKVDTSLRIHVTQGQLSYEMNHLRSKFAIRDPVKLRSLEYVRIPLPNPMFVTIKGDIENWEKVFAKDNHK